MSKKIRAVTITEFQEWIHKHEVLVHCWLSGKIFNEMAEDFMDADTQIKDKTLLMKYIDLTIDTRCMTIWSITARGGGREVTVRDNTHSRKGVEYTILDETLRLLNAQVRR